MTAGLVDPSSFSNGPCSVRKQQVSFSVSIRGVRRINAFTKTFIIITVIWPNEKCGRRGCCASVILSSHNASEKMSVMGEKTITMSRKEVKRLAVIQRLLHQQITTREAAMLLGLSVRQVYRIKARVLQEGEEGIVHKNRGRKPAHALSEDLRHTIVELYQSKRYKGSNDHHFAELLAEYEGIRVSPSTVRRVLRSAGIRPARKRRPPKTHCPRPRKPQAGL